MVTIATMSGEQFDAYRMREGEMGTRGRQLIASKISGFGSVFDSGFGSCLTLERYRTLTRY